MTYDIQALFQTHKCRVVLAADPKVAIAIRDAIVQTHPSYHHKSDPIFSHRKFGPFLIKNKKSIWQILAKTSKIKQEGPAFLQQQLNALNLRFYADRSPRTLSMFQRFCASVLYTSLNGGSAFLIYECPEEMSRGIVQWLENYMPNNYDVIWISCHSPKKIDKLMDEETRSGSHYSFFTVEKEKVTPLDKTLLETLREIPPEIVAERAFQEGRRHDSFSGAGLPSSDGNTKEAFRWYKQAAEAGHLCAQNMLGLLYQSGHGGCQIDIEQAFHWYDLAAFRTDYDEKTADPNTKSSRTAARKNVMGLMQHLESWSELVQKYAGAEAEAFIQETDAYIQEVHHQRLIEEAAKSIPSDLEYMREWHKKHFDF